MHRVVFDPANLTGQLKQEWSAWLLEAETATNRIIQAWEQWRQNGSLGTFTYGFEEQVWGRLKEWLIKNVFHNKCAYCETREARSPYHAEHFRPKGRVRYREKGKKRLQRGRAVDEIGQETDHPGYFWLAYNWQNLLPSCNYCNSALGKNDQFPVSKRHASVKRLTAGEIVALRKQQIKSQGRPDTFYLQPEDLDVFEAPLLLHPYLDHPDEHLIFGEFGIVAAREDPQTGQPSAKGTISIQVYNLDGDGLRAARHFVQTSVLQDYSNEFVRERSSRRDKIAAAKKRIDGYVNHEEPYSTAVLDYLRLMYPDHQI
jgi:hypothetical protein